MGEELKIQSVSLAERYKKFEVLKDTSDTLFKAHFLVDEIFKKVP